MHVRTEGCGLGPEWSEAGEATERSAEVPDSTAAGCVGPAVARAGRAEADENTTIAAAAMIEALADPVALQQLMQSWVRDLGLATRESGADAAASRADDEAERRTEALAQAREAAERAANEGFIAKVCGYIAGGLALVAGAIGAAFTGGVTLALGVAALILIAGATTTQVLVDAGVVPREEGGWVALGCSIAATICSLGATAAGAGAGVATTAARIASDAVTYSSATMQTVQGSAACVAATSTHSSERSTATAEEAAAARDDAYAGMDEDIAGVRELMRTSGRIGARLRAIRDAIDEGRRAALVRA